MTAAQANQLTTLANAIKALLGCEVRPVESTGAAIRAAPFPFQPGSASIGQQETEVNALVSSGKFSAATGAALIAAANQTSAHL